MPWKNYDRNITIEDEIQARTADLYTKQSFQEFGPFATLLSPMKFSYFYLIFVNQTCKYKVFPTKPEASTIC